MNALELVIFLPIRTGNLLDELGVRDDDTVLVYDESRTTWAPVARVTAACADNAVVECAAITCLAEAASAILVSTTIIVSTTVLIPRIRYASRLLSLSTIVIDISIPALLLHAATLDCFPNTLGQCLGVCGRTLDARQKAL